MTVTVIIPTYKPDGKFRKLVKELKNQTYPIEKILILNTEACYWKDALIEGIQQAEVHHITKEEFDHGRTRAMERLWQIQICWCFLHRMQHLQITK